MDRRYTLFFLIRTLIEEVMKSRQLLIEIVGKFIPKIVKMNGAKGKQWDKERKIGPL